MKCECTACSGTGEITCPECSGDGYWETSIEHFKLDPYAPNYRELSGLQNDARRVRRDALRLAKMHPERAEAYAKQFEACLHVIDRDVDRLLGKEGSE